MLLSLLIMLLIVYYLQPKRQHKVGAFRQKSAIKTDILPCFRGNQKKPDWVVAEVIRLKAILGQQAGCRKVAQTFNRLHGHRETVGKSFVNQIIQKNQFEIMVTRRKIKNKLPRRIAVNLTWAMDLSFYTTADKVIQPFIGIIDHGSRKVISLNTVINKSSWVMLGYLCLAIGQ